MCFPSRIRSATKKLSPSLAGNTEAKTTALASWPGKIRPSSKILLAAVLMAVLLRLALLLWAFRHGMTIDNEGAEYARLAENLLAGRGYIGMFANGTQLNFPPLYPLLIAAFSLLLPSVELAAHLINVAVGAALVVPMFKLAQKIYNRSVAAVVAIMVAVHPVLVARSALQAISEVMYLTLLMAGLYYVVLWIDDQKNKTCILAGLFFGLAYLTRSEAFLVVGAISFVGLLLAIVVQDRRRVLLAVLCMAGTFVLVASPYVIFLSLKAGRFLVEGKGALVYAQAQKINAGMNHTQAMREIGDDLSEQGVFMKSNYEALKAAPYTLHGLASLIRHGGARNLSLIYSTISTSQLEGAPVLFLLAVIGLVGAAWDRHRLMKEGVLLTTGLAMVLTLLLVPFYWLRYFYGLMGLLLLWAGKGTEELNAWSHGAGSDFVASYPRTVFGFVVQWFAIFLVMALSCRAVLLQGEFEELTLTGRKTAGQWLAARSPRPERLMGDSLIPAYYAKADFTYLPFASSNVSLRYISEKRPDFIVLLEFSKQSCPYLTEWFDHGIPDRRAELIYDQTGRHHERVKIYQWKNAPGQR